MNSNATVAATMRPTQQTYDELQQAYDHFNQALFGGQLHNCLITLQREKRTYGVVCGRGRNPTLRLWPTIMAYDKYTGREWVVSPDQIEAAQSSGKAGVETRPGTVAVRAIRSEDADILPFKWLGYGLVAGFFVVYSTRKPKAAPKA